MSADDWYKCPFCKENHQKIIEKQYGKLPYEEFKEKVMNSKPEHPKHKGQSETIRYDYEVWMDTDGVWHFKGDCHCALCNRKWNADIKIKSDRQ